MENVLKVVVPAEKTSQHVSAEEMENVQVEDQVYSLSQLQDLQSKLMLVAGKATQGKEQVDRFVEVRQEGIVQCRCVMCLQIIHMPAMALDHI